MYRDAYTNRSLRDEQSDGSQPPSAGSSSSGRLEYQRSPSPRPSGRDGPGMFFFVMASPGFDTFSFTITTPDVDGPGPGSGTILLFRRNTSMALPRALASTTEPVGLSQTTAATSPGGFLDSSANVTLGFFGSLSFFLVARV